MYKMYMKRLFKIKKVLYDNMGFVGLCLKEKFIETEKLWLKGVKTMISVEP